MSKEEREEPSKENELDETRPKRKLRSPCLDSHFEAYLLRSRWTVGNLYASNLYLGHVHVKYVQDIDRQLKTWLHFTERDQQKLAKRVLELEALKKKYFEKSMRFVDKEFSTKPGSHKMISRHISVESAKPQNSYSKQNVPLRRLHSHVQSRQLPDVFPPKHTLDPEKARSRPKAADVSLHPLKLLLPNQTQNQERKRPGQRRTKSGYVYQKGSVAPIHQEVLSGRFSSLSSRWRSRTSSFANPRLSGVSNEKGGKNLVPKWVPLAFRL